MTVPVKDFLKRFSIKIKLQVMRKKTSVMQKSKLHLKRKLIRRIFTNYGNSSNFKLISFLPDFIDVKGKYF